MAKSFSPYSQSLITSIHNPLIKQIRKLHRAKERRKQNLLLLEGTNLLISAVNNHCRLVSICCTPQWRGHHPHLWETAVNCAVRAEIVNSLVMNAITTTLHPDGVLATAERTNSHRCATSSRIQLGLVLERVQDPGNLGTIIRTAVAAGAQGLWLSKDSVELDNPKVLRASVGEWFKLPMAVSDNLSELIQNYQSQGMQVLATLPEAALSYWQVDLTKPTLILLGNEGAGLSEELTSWADCKIKIPLCAGVESLNVAIATALVLYEAQRQKLQAGSSYVPIN